MVNFSQKKKKILHYPELNLYKAGRFDLTFLDSQKYKDLATKQNLLYVLLLKN